MLPVNALLKKRRKEDLLIWSYLERIEPYRPDERLKKVVHRSGKSKAAIQEPEPALPVLCHQR